VKKCKVVLGWYALWNIGHGRYAEGDWFATRHEAECAIGHNFALWEVREVQVRGRQQ
jgi:hypothetical protein